jgi:hypothetical protein
VRSGRGNWGFCHQRDDSFAPRLPCEGPHEGLFGIRVKRPATGYGPRGPETGTPPNNSGSRESHSFQGMPRYETMAHKNEPCRDLAEFKATGSGVLETCRWCRLLEADRTVDDQTKGRNAIDIGARITFYFNMAG